MFRNARTYLLALVAGGLLAAPWPAFADAFRLVPALAVSEEFNDNVFFSVANHRSSFITTLAPSLAVEERTERLSGRVDLGVQGLLYTAGRELDSLEQRYRGDLRYRLSPRVDLQAAAGFERSSRPDRLVESSGLVLTQESDRQQYSLGSDLVVTEKGTLQLGYGYERLDYRTGSLSGVEGHSLNAGLLYDLSAVLPLLKLKTAISGATNRYATSTVESYSATCGVQYPLHELWGMQADVGGRLTRSSFTEQVLIPPGIPATAERTNEDWGWVASVQLNYRAEQGGARFSLVRNVQNAVGRSGSTELTAVSGEVSRRFTHELSGALGGGVYRNTSDANQFASSAIDEVTLRLAPSLRYAVSPDLELAAGYEFALARNRLAGTDAERNKVYLRLSAQLPMFE